MQCSQIPHEAMRVLNRLRNNGFPAFLVGGCVRDLLLGKPPKDYDICTSATPGEVKNLFSRVLETGIQYGTVTVLSSDLAVEVTTFRSAVANPEGPRASEILFGSTAAEDVLKRDFTINGLLFDGEQVVDYVGGLADLKNRVIRGIENPTGRFREDPLRMLRAIRLACLLGFEVETQTQTAIAQNAALIARVAVERVREELNKILLSPKPAQGLRQLHQFALLRLIMPELEACCGFAQCNPHHAQDVWEHSLAVVERTPPELILRWAALLHDVGKPLTFSRDGEGIGHFYGHHLKSADLAFEILTRFRFDHKRLEQVVALAREHMSLHDLLGRSALKRLINRVGAENIPALLELYQADLPRPLSDQEMERIKRHKATLSQILEGGEPLRPRQLAINGDDLMALGIKPGRKMGRVITALMERVIEHPEWNTREQLLALVGTLEEAHEDAGKNHQ